MGGRVVRTLGKPRSQSPASANSSQFCSLSMRLGPWSLLSPQVNETSGCKSSSQSPFGINSKQGNIIPSACFSLICLWLPDMLRAALGHNPNGEIKAPVVRTPPTFVVLLRDQPYNNSHTNDLYICYMAPSQKLYGQFQKTILSSLCIWGYLNSK